MQSVLTASRKLIGGRVSGTLNFSGKAKNRSDSKQSWGPHHFLEAAVDQCSIVSFGPT